MKAIHLTSVRPLKTSQFWLLATAAGLIAIHLTLLLRSDNLNLLGISILFWLAVSSLLWQKRNSLNLESGIFSSLLGLSLLAFVLLKSFSLSHFGLFLCILPFIAAFGLALLASGVQGATSAPKARYQEGLTRQASTPKTKVLDNATGRRSKTWSRCARCMVKNNGLISENKTAIKNATNILSSTARKVSQSVSTNYIEAVSLVTPKPQTSKNRKISSNTASTNSTEQPSSPHTAFFKPEKIKCGSPVVSLNSTDNYSTHSQGETTNYRLR
jgi:hypothetical protein